MTGACPPRRAARSALRPRTLRGREEYLRGARSPDVSIVGFDRPEGVPDYEILETHRSERNGARGATLVVDTRATTERDLTLVARDIKARYSNLDSDDFLDYRGGALIFDTAAGAYFQGFVYGPPNNKGYLLNAAD